MDKRVATVGFVIQDHKVLLAQIQYPDRLIWNGIGGFVEPGEEPEDGLLREFNEETYIQPIKEHIKKVKELESNIHIKFYFVTAWQGELKTKDPTLKQLQWFSFDAIPYDEMHEGVDQWLPEALKNHEAQL